MYPALLATSGQLPKIPSDWPGWLVIIAIGLLLLRFLLKVLGVLK